MASIFAISADVETLGILIERLEAEEVPDQEHLTRLGAFLMHQERLLAEKIDSYVSFYRHLEAREKARKEEARHLQELARQDANKRERLKEAVKFVSESLGQPKLEGKTRSITISGGGYAIEIIDEDTIPTEFKQEIITTKIDKKAIRDQFVKSGEIVAGTQPRSITRILFR